MKEHILVVLPHPDDEAFGASGTITLHTKKGVPVTYACATLGEMGRNMGLPPFANRESLPLIRKKELEEACDAMGIKDLRLLGYRDKTLEFENIEEVADTIYKLLDELKPTLVITHYPGFAVHPDHDACGAATIKAISRLDKENRPIVYAMAFSKDCRDVLGDPDIRINIEEVADQKIASLKAHKSQTSQLVAGLEEKLKNGDPDTKNWLSREVFWTYRFND
ncbi:bacillithiol biosynthesis deacetylase BshB2 [Bacillus salitolerans]|uniref:Bacillithiol biosynthesis deacetylase BshB2 n=1 Tax=Bacillus salitolerans TaxID=1437434 RepID=A0ABW4LQ22_9BACI